MTKKHTVSNDYIEQCKAYTESVKESVESAKSYIKFVLLIGYGSFFGMWKLLEDELTREQRLWSASLMSFSLVLFVLYELANMYWNGIQTLVISYRAKTWINFGKTVFWFIIFTIALLSALIAIAVLFYAFGEGLYGLYQDSEAN